MYEEYVFSFSYLSDGGVDADVQCVTAAGGGGKAADAAPGGDAAAKPGGGKGGKGGKGGGVLRPGGGAEAAQAEGEGKVEKLRRDGAHVARRRPSPSPARAACERAQQRRQQQTPQIHRDDSHPQIRTLSELISTLAPLPENRQLSMRLARPVRHLSAAAPSAALSAALSAPAPARLTPHGGVSAAGQVYHADTPAE